jgi:hypothetical protein
LWSKEPVNLASQGLDFRFTKALLTAAQHLRQTAAVHNPHALDALALRVDVSRLSTSHRATPPPANRRRHCWPWHSWR